MTSLGKRVTVLVYREGDAYIAMSETINYGKTFKQEKF